MSKCAFEIGEYNVAIQGYSSLKTASQSLLNTNKEGIIYHSAKAYAGIENYIKARGIIQKNNK